MKVAIETMMATSHGLRSPAAERLGMSVTWLYRNAAKLPFTRRIGGRTVRFSAAGIARYIGNRRAGVAKEDK